MSSGVTLTSAVRQNLLSLQDTASLTATTQNRLATGLKVSSALDNPVNFFTAVAQLALKRTRRHLERHPDHPDRQPGHHLDPEADRLAKLTANQALSTQVTTTGTASSAYTSAANTVDFYVNGESKTASLLATDTIDQAITKLNTAVGSTMFSKDTSGTKLVLNAGTDVEFETTVSQTALGFAAGTGESTTDKYGAGNSSAGQSADLTVAGAETREKLAEQYNNLLTQITQRAKDASFNGVNLISNGDKSNKLYISFNEKDSSNLDVQGRDLTSDGLTAIEKDSGSAIGVGNFLRDSDVKATNARLTTASDTLRAASSTFGSNLSVVQNRQTFSKNLINVLDTGAANLTQADLNQEAANSQVLTTRLSLGISALSLANQAQQGILQLLR